MNISVQTATINLKNCTASVSQGQTLPALCAKVRPGALCQPSPPCPGIQVDWLLPSAEAPAAIAAAALQAAPAAEACNGFGSVPLERTGIANLPFIMAALRAGFLSAWSNSHRHTTKALSQLLTQENRRALSVRYHRGSYFVLA